MGKRKERKESSRKNTEKFVRPEGGERIKRTVRPDCGEEMKRIASPDCGEGMERTASPGCGEGMEKTASPDCGEGMKKTASPGCGEGMKRTARPGCGEGMKRTASLGCGEGMKRTASPGCGEGMKRTASPGCGEGMKRTASPGLEEEAEKRRTAVSPLATEKVSRLLGQFALPSIVAMLVSAIYNIVDQFFIGHSVGPLGNAATNIAFPLSMMCTSLALLFGIGGASNFNLVMGEGKKEKAPYFIGNAASMLLGSGTLLFLAAEVFLHPMLRLFGSPADVLPYAEEYVKITALGFPFLIITTGGGHLMRADGSPKMAMICNLSGAVINTFLDALFVMGFGWGMAGAAAATVMGQIFSGILVIRYLMRYKTVVLEKKHFLPQWAYLGKIMALGAANSFNQIAMMVVQISLNNLLKFYGAQSVYGESVPIACAGIVMKVNQVFFSIIIGISQGTQPIEGYNYGAGQYGRVRETYGLAVKAGMALSVGAFLIFQLFPRQLLSLFGDGSEAYYQFGVSYFRIFLAGTLINFLQPLSSSFFTSIGKAYKGMFLSLTRQILFLLPLLFTFPKVMGIEGLLYAGPVADGLAFGAAIIMVRLEFRTMKKLEQKEIAVS